MKKKAIILAIAGVLATPNAFAAEDDMGMHFTSASEGFYGSIRAGYFGNDKRVDDYGSRLGVNGFNDLGNGLEGFYSFEYRTDAGDTNVRNNKSLVGLRGEFGEFKLGRGFDAVPYELVYADTDIGNSGSGLFQGNYSGSSNVYYRTPNMDGFESGMGFQVDGSGDNANGEDLNNWNIAAKYSMQGLTAGVGYSASPGGIQVENENGVVPGMLDDKSAWGISLGYGQDNWSLNGWYGEDNSGDQKFAGAIPAVPAVPAVLDDPLTPNVNEEADAVAVVPLVPGTAAQDRTAFSLAGKVVVNQMDFYAVYESRDAVESGKTDTYATLGVTYHLGTKARVWAEYIAKDYDSDADADDYVAIGLRHDF